MAISTLLVIPLQLSAYRQSTAGADALGRVRAKWAARAGVETYIAFLEWDAENEHESDAALFRSEMESLARGELVDANRRPVARYLIQHFNGREVVDGPADAHAKLNVNLLPEESLMELEGMTSFMAEAILGWIGRSSEGGGEGGGETMGGGGAAMAMGGGGGEGEPFFQSHHLVPYEPRRGPIRHFRELELIPDIPFELLRGDDWNLNGLPDPDTDYRDFDPGWSAFLTAASREPGPHADHQPRLNLTTASPQEIVERIGVDFNQANAIYEFARGEGNSMAGLLTMRLGGGQGGGEGQQGQRRRGRQSGGGATSGQPGGAQQPQARDLTDEQLNRLFAEATMGTTKATRSGRLNINAASREVLQLLPGIDPIMAEQLYQFRLNRAEDVRSIAELLAVPGMTRERLAELAPLIDTRSNVYVINSRGTAVPGMTEVELMVTIDRSTLPITIIDYVER